MGRSAEERKRFVEVRAEQMKASPTQAERAMWKILEPLHFLRQYVREGFTKNGLKWTYIMDFYSPESGLCVEVDGGVHRKRKGRDRRRDARLAGEGICTLRFSNSEVLKNPALCRGIIEEDMRLIAKGIKVNRT